MNIEILYEDNHLLIVNKKPGELVQSDISGVESLQEKLKNYIKEKYSKHGNVFLGIVHRLDKPVSGITIFARTSKAAGRLHEQFLSRDIIKRYIAVVKKNTAIKTDWLVLKHGLKTNDGFVEITDIETPGTKNAELRFREITSNNKYSLAAVDLLTGRKHQIRAQFSKIGLPVVGDVVYGSDEKTADNSILLHAIYIKFIHPVKNTVIELQTDYPKRFLNKITADYKTITKIIKDEE
jgi:23S rRNA pseudouridine1911/1915/1917 synthase